MKKILITAYSVNPYKGSEDGTGWNIAHGLSKEFEVTLITRKNNREAIEQYLQEFPEFQTGNLNFAYFDLPYWARFWKKWIGERGYVLYFYLWQLFVPLFIKRKKLKFDLAHALNFHSDSHPHFLWLFRNPTVWGPIGHHPKVPRGYLEPLYGKRNYFKDRLYFGVKWALRNLDPFYWIAKRKTDRVLVINSSIPSVTGKFQGEVHVLPAVASKPMQRHERTDEKFTALSIGRFHYIKGFDLAIKSFTEFALSLHPSERQEVQLIIVGKGTENDRIRAWIEESEVKDLIKVIHWVPLDEIPRYYSNADVFLFPSHEGAGMVVPEALSYGLPVVCMDNPGPGELANGAGIRVPYSNYSETIQGLANAMEMLYHNRMLYHKFSTAASRRYQQHFGWQQKTNVIAEIYRELLDEEATISIEPKSTGQKAA